MIANEKIKDLPTKAGVYQFFDANGKIIYVGKAKNLKKRVSSYFQKTHDNYKLKLLVKKIEDVKYIVVGSEQDAFLLENNLIKKYQPRYNINLKDDKSYPWITIKNEPFPRVFLTRKYVNDGSLYFGPFTSALMVRTLLELVRELYPLRTCKYNLSRENIERKKYKVCLEYHIGNCLGPCENLQSSEDYDENIEQIKQILKGNLSSVQQFFKNRMKELADELKFEEASRIKNKVDLLDKFQAKSTIVNQQISNVDVFSIDMEDNEAYVNYLKVVKGSVIQAHSMILKKRLVESKEELLELAVTDIRDKFNSTAKEIILPFSISYPFENVKITVPKIGDKQKLLELSKRNATYFKFEYRKAKIKPAGVEKHVQRVLETIQKDLRLHQLPKHIECFDNSNIQGKNPVAACVVFRNGRPSKKEYRHYHIKTVVGADDFASMQEVVYRRYRRLIEEEKSLPQLIVIDGGKGQLNAALASLRLLGIDQKIAIIGIAKKLEEIYFPGDSIPLYLNKNSETLKTIQYLRNEAHRFGITFHRKKRDSGMLQSELDNIKGIGEKTKTLLLKEFKSLEELKYLPVDKLQNLIGKHKATIVKEKLK